METFESFEQVLYQVNEQTFDEIALKLFEFQAKHNPVYAEYLGYLGVTPSSVRNIESIPYLPVSFFKSHEIKTGTWQSEAVFTSSGTTASAPAHHHVHSTRFYLENAVRCYSFFYSDPGRFITLALLPSYAEREGSSLIMMIEDFIRRGGGGFYHTNPDGLIEAQKKTYKGKKIMLWGVAYALLDLAETSGLDLSNCIVMETGGMKGRRQEITRAELHEFLRTRLKAKVIHSEYGMTELLSQAYSTGEGQFRCPPWMRVYVRDPEDPRDVGRGRESGGINIIDLANIRTCAFIETQDLGKIGQKGSFEVLGRLDNSDIRGCNLLVE